MKRIYTNIFLLTLVITLLLPVTAVAQTDSLAVWENIADGTLTSDWVENETTDWKPQNDTGVWEYNCTVTKDVSFTFNESRNADRWFNTFEVMSDDDECGIGSVMVNNLTSYYAIIYYYNSVDHGPDGFPSAHLVCYDTDHFDYWNGTGFENNSSNASDLDNDWEKDYSDGDFFRVKVMWDFHSTIGCSLHFKLWDPSGDEYPLWMVDLEFPNHPSITTTTFKSGLFVDSRYDNDPSETDFRRIFFWDTAYDMYVPKLPIVNDYIACPTVDCSDVYTMYDEYADLDPYDIYNTTQLLKEYVNLWDLQVIYSEEFYDAAMLPYNQNDSVYHFSLMFTDTRAFYTQMFGPGIPDDFPDNMLMMKTFLPIDGSSNETDFMLLRIDTDNNDVYDSYDYAIWSNDTDLILYQGWTPFTNSYFADMWSGPVGANDFGGIFRDKLYYEWDIYINWDMIYNGSSGERVGDDLCRMSIGWYDQDTALTSEMVFMQDYDPADDDDPYPATDGMDFDDDPVFLDFNDSQNWLYFQVDESISGEPLADPDDPVSIYDNMDPTTSNLLQNVLPIFIAIAVLGLIVGLIFSMGATKESLITIMIVTIFAVVLIQIILGL
jgi:hypothetical protein